MATTHILIGTGEGVNVPQSVINESLRDVINEGDHLVLPWYGKPTDALRMVYDYVFDQQVQFLLILTDTGSKVPKAFTDSDHGAVINPNGGLAKAYYNEYTKDQLGSVVVLGGEDDETTNDMLMDVYALLSRNGVTGPVLDLGDGLTTIEVEVEAEEESAEEESAEEESAEEESAEEESAEEESAEEAPPTLTEVEYAYSLLTTDEDPTVEDDAGETEASDPDPFSFSYEELSIMPLKVLKRYAEQVVSEDDMPKGNAKGPFILAIETAREDADISGGQHGDDVICEMCRVEEALEYVQMFFRDLQAAAPSRVNAIVLTKVEEALLWYHYGADVHSADAHGGS
jgi:hypothetical protein